MKKEIIMMNSVQQNEFLIWRCLEKHNMKKLYELIENASLTPFILSTMYVLDYNKQDIIQVLLHANNPKPEIFDWLSYYFNADELREVFVHFKDVLPSHYPKDEDCVHLELWDVLIHRGNWNLVAQKAPEQLEKLPYKTAIATLMRANFDKYADIALEKKLYEEILSVENGWKYLLEHGKKDYVFTRMKNSIIASLLPTQEIFEYCREKGWLADMYKEGLYSLLLKNQEFSLFIENHNIDVEFLRNFPQKVQWENLWQYYRSDETYCNHLIEMARFNKSVPECKDFLSKHTGFFSFLNR